jgi:hypothetical protein
MSCLFLPESVAVASQAAETNIRELVTLGQRQVAERGAQPAQLTQPGVSYLNEKGENC